MRVASIGAWATAVPVVIVVAVMVCLVGGERRGHNYLSAPPFRNSAEAAAAGDAAAALRLLRMGDNPSRIHPIRSDIISSDVVHATTLEAAMWSRNIGMIRMLDREGAFVDADQRRELACLARDLDLPEVASYLAADQRCVRGVALKRLVARSRPEGADNHE